MQGLMILGFSLLALFGAPLAGFAGGEPPAVASPHQPVRGDLDAARAGWALIGEGALLIDVRSAEEFGQGHLAGAINIVHTDLDALAAAIGQEHARRVVLYCGTGRRAGLAVEQLEQRGYRGLFNATGYDALLATQP